MRGLWGLALCAFCACGDVVSVAQDSGASDKDGSAIDGPVVGDGDANGDLDAGIECAYSCSIDTVDMSSDCTGRVQPTMAGQEVISVLNMEDMNSLNLKFTVCDPTEWVLHLGDSPTNNGGGGDASSSSNDAEIQLEGTVLTGLPNQNAPSTDALFNDATFVPASGCATRTWNISDQGFETPATPIDETSEFLLRLDPPTDLEGTPDALWYLGLNRTYGSAARVGTGITVATLCMR